MTVEEKRTKVWEHCRKTSCSRCVLSRDGDFWGADTCHDSKCLSVAVACEENLDKALALIDGNYAACAALPVREAEGTKSAARVIQLEVADGSALQVAYAICKYYLKNNSYKENALIDLGELTEHIDAYVRAERKTLEYKKPAEEG